MPSVPGPEHLVIPGPTPVPDRVRRALDRQSCDYLAPDFLQAAETVFADLKRVFRTEGQVFVYASNGHGGWEAALVNTLSPGDRVLVPETGAFSESWREMAGNLGLAADKVPGDWRHAVDPDAVAAALAADEARSVKAVLLVQVDTAASVLTDVAAVRRAMDAVGHPALLMVDTIASLATTEFRMDDWGVDVTVSSSQKGLMTPPGLGIVAAGPKALAASEQARLPRHFWSWRERQRPEPYRRHGGTAPMQLIFALRAALDMLFEEGLDAAIARHARLAGAVRRAVEVWGEAGALSFNALLPHQRADSVTTVRLPEGFDGEAIRNEGRRLYNLTLGGGPGPLRGQVFRIGHMGHINETSILGALATTELILRGLGLPLGRGAVDAAIEALAPQVRTGDAEEDRRRRSG